AQEPDPTPDNPGRTHTYVYVVGASVNAVFIPGFPFIPFPSKAAIAGFTGFDDFLAKFDPSASGSASLVYSTPIGGNGVATNGGGPLTIARHDLAVDAVGDVYTTRGGNLLKLHFDKERGALSVVYSSGVAGDAVGVDGGGYAYVGSGGVI